MIQISQAARLASLAHTGQYRKYSNSDQPYICHPMRVAGRVSLVHEATNEMIAAAWLHDTIEDTDVTEELLLKEFGPVVTKLVVEVTNPSKQHKHLKRAVRRKMDHDYLATVSREAKIIKLCDRLDNLADLPTDPLVPPDFRKLYLKETKDLLEVLRGAESGLEQMLESILEENQ